MGTTAKDISSRKWLPRRLARRFARSDRGVTIIDFAIVGPLFFAFIGATLETALAFFASYTLDSAVIGSSRLIRTGQESYISEADGANYREALCGQTYGIFDCAQLRISVQGFDDVDDLPDIFPIPIDPDTGDWTMDNSYDNAEPLQIMMIEAYYKWPTFFNIPGLNAGQTADGKRLLAATHVIRTEPF